MAKESTLYQDNRILLTVNKENKKLLTHENMGDFQMCFDNKKKKQTKRHVLSIQHSRKGKSRESLRFIGQGREVSTNGYEDICKMMKML